MSWRKELCLRNVNSESSRTDRKKVERIRSTICDNQLGNGDKCHQWKWTNRIYVECLSLFLAFEHNDQLHKSAEDENCLSIFAHSTHRWLVISSWDYQVSSWSRSAWKIRLCVPRILSPITERVWEIIKLITLIRITLSCAGRQSERERSMCVSISWLPDHFLSTFLPSSVTMWKLRRKDDFFINN